MRDDYCPQQKWLLPDKTKRSLAEGLLLLLMPPAEAPRGALEAAVGPELSTAQLYASLPLTMPQSIRLLDLSSANPTDPLSGTLRVVDLATSPRFTALSYAWGEVPLSVSAPAPTISCNDGCQVAISPNCCDALLALRRLPGEEELTIWVDAICINQKDGKEKGIQLPLMATIYTFAETAYIWLGIGNEDAHRAMDWFQEASATLPSTPGNPWFRDNKRQTAVRADRWSFVWKLFCFYCKVTYWGEPPSAIIETHIVASLLEVSWFQRAWTFQEIILASNPVIVCGPKAIDWAVWQKGIQLALLPKVGDDVPLLQKWRRNLGVPFWGDVPTHTRAKDLWPRLMPWLRLFQLWDNAPRPTHWNGKELRNISTPAADGMYTAEGYRGEVFRFIQQPFSIFEQVFAILSMLIGVWVMVVVVGRFTTLQLPLRPFFITFLLFSLICPLVIELEIQSWSPGVNHGVPELSVPELSNADFETRQTGVGQVAQPSQSTVSSTKVLTSTYLAGVLEALRERRASMAKDKAFALYGVMQRMGINPSQPDYSKPVGEVYHRLMLDFLEWRPSLSVLLLDAGLPLAGIPSWVPDWSTTEERSWLPKAYIYSSIADETSSTSSGRPAPQPGVKISPCKLKLTLRGAVVGSVTDNFGPFETTKTSDLGAVDVDTAPNIWPAMYVISQWLMEARRGLPISIHYESIPQAVITTLSGGIKPDSHTELQNTFDRWYRIMLESLELARLKAQEDSKPGTPASYSQLYSLEALTEFLSPRLLDDLEVLKYAIDCVNQLAGKRSLFYSRDGHIGTGPPGTTPGDNIVVFDGISTPMITRSGAEGNQTVVGPAYAPGLIHVTEANDTRKLRWEDITLV